VNTTNQFEILAPNKRALRHVAGLRELVAALMMTTLLASWSQAQQTSSAPIYDGFTEAKYKILVAANEIGLVESIFVEVGDQVKAGQVIAQLEDSLQKSAVHIALTTAKMRGEIEMAKAEVALRRTRTELLRELAKNEMARPDELARAESELEIAVARETNAMEQQHLRELELGRAELQLARRRVISPMDAVVSQVFRFPGEYLTPSDPAVIELLVIDELIAVFNIPAEEVSQLRVGSAVSVSLRSLARIIQAKVTTIAPEIEGESGTVQVRIVLDNANHELLAGDRCTLQRRSDDSPSPPQRQAASSGPSRSVIRGQTR